MIRANKWIWEWSPDWCWELRNFRGARMREVMMSYKCCEGVRGLRFSRRYFLKQGGVAMVGLSAMPAFLQRAVAATPMPNKKQLVVLFQRGAADGLNIVVPFGEPNYYRLRPSIAIPRPGRGAGDAAIDLDGFFGLHPSFAPLEPLFRKNQLALIHAAGSPDPTRSHFDAQDFMESGTPGKTGEDGWLNRALTSEPGVSPLRAIAVGAQLPRTLRGDRQAVAVNNLQQFESRNKEMAAILETMYASTPDPRLMASGRETFEAVKMIESVNRNPYTPAGGAQYQGGFGNALQQVARLIKANIGVEAAFADIGGWDHHA